MISFLEEYQTKKELDWKNVTIERRCHSISTSTLTKFLECDFLLFKMNIVNNSNNFI